MPTIRLDKRTKTIKVVNRKDTLRLQHTGKPGPPGAGAYWGGIVGSIQNQLDLIALFTTKSDVGHGHTIVNITGLQAALDSLQDGIDSKSAIGHIHAIADTTGLQAALDARSLTGHVHTIANVTGLQTALDAKAALSHTHTIANITSLQTTLDGKAALSHTHTIANTTGLQTALDAKESLANKGIANGYAPLNASVKIDSAYLPSYVDDVNEYANLAAFPATGITSAIYVAMDTNKVYRWSGSGYVEISPQTIQSATDTPFSPTGNIAATTVQTALAELDTEKVAKAGDTMTGALLVRTATGTSSGIRYQSTTGDNIVTLTNSNTDAVPSGYVGLYRGTTLSGTMQATAGNGLFINSPAGTIDLAIAGITVLRTGGSGISSYQNLYPQTTNTTSLGQSGNYWSNLFATRQYLNTTAYFDGATSGVADLTGQLKISAASVPIILKDTTTSDVLGGLNRIVTSGGTFRFDTNTAAGSDFSTYLPRLEISLTTGAIIMSTTANPGLQVGNGATGYLKLGDATMKKTSGNFFSFSNDGVQGINNLIIGQDSPDLTKPLFVKNNLTAARIVATIQGAASQTGNLLELQDSTGADLAVFASNGFLGFGTLAPTHTISLPSTSTGIALYNTADQTTNYERAVMQWSGTTFNILTGKAGTGVNRSLLLGTTSTSLIVRDTADTSGFYQFTRGTGSANAVGIITSGTWNASSGVNTMVHIAPTISQTSTAGYTALLVNPTETSVGSGTKLLADFQVGGVSKVRIDNSGNLVAPTVVANVLTAAPTSGVAEIAVKAVTGQVAQFSMYIDNAKEWHFEATPTQFRIVESGVDYPMTFNHTAGAANVEIFRMLTTRHVTPSTTATYDLGATSAYYRYLYAGRQYVNSTAYFDGATAGSIAVQGGIVQTGNFSTSGTISSSVSISANGSLMNNGLISVNTANTQRSSSIELKGKNTANAGGISWQIYADSDNQVVGTKMLSIYGYPKGDVAGATQGYEQFMNFQFTSYVDSPVSYTKVARIMAELQMAGQIIPDANGTRNLGSPALYWNQVYANRINLSSTVYIDGSTAGQSNYSGGEFVVNNNQITVRRDAASTLVGFSNTLNTVEYGRIRTASTNQFGILAVNRNLIMGSNNGSLEFTAGTGTETTFMTLSGAGHLSLASVSTGLSLYNTVDQTTNFERLLVSSVSNVFTIASTKGGTGAQRTLRLEQNDGSTNYARFNVTRSGSNFFNFDFGAGTSAASVTTFTGSFAATSGSQAMVAITPTITQTLTGGYTALLINPTETTVGSGTKLLADLQVGGVSKFSVDNTGAMTANAPAKITSTAYPQLRLEYSSGVYATLGVTVNGYAVLANANLGIGTATPGEKLVVAGNIAPEATGTRTVGTSAAYFSQAYATRHYFNSSAYLDGATAGSIGVTGILATVNAGDQITFQGSSAKINSTNGSIKLVTGFTGKTFSIGDSAGTNRLITLMDTGFTTFGGADTSPTHAITIANTANAFALYATDTTVTDYERLTMGFNNGSAYISSGADGTGSSKPLILAASTGDNQVVGNHKIIIGNGSPVFDFTVANTDSSDIYLNFASNISGATGSKKFINISPTVTYTGTSSYTGLFMNITETSTGSGTKMFADFQIAGASKFSVDNGGKIRLNNGSNAWDIYRDNVTTGDLIFSDTNNGEGLRITRAGKLMLKADPTDSLQAVTKQYADNLASGVRAVRQTITQTAHGFVVKQPVRYNGTTWAAATNDSAANAEAIGVVTTVTDANTFVVTTHGYVSGLTGLVAGTVYYVPDVAGAFTATPPATSGLINKPMFVATSTTEGYVVNYRGIAAQALGAVNYVVGVGTSKITVASSAPASPSTGDLWVDTA